MADLLAKKGTNIKHTKSSTNLHTTKTLIRRRTKQQFLNDSLHTTSQKIWNNIQDTWDNNKNKPRKESTTTFRLNTGHDCLAAHLHKLKILQSYHCVICNQTTTVMNKDHLLKCKKLKNTNNIVELYWDARRQMKQIFSVCH